MAKKEWSHNDYFQQFKDIKLQQESAAIKKNEDAYPIQIMLDYAQWQKILLALGYGDANMEKNLKSLVVDFQSFEDECKTQRRVLADAENILNGAERTTYTKLSTRAAYVYNFIEVIKMRLKTMLTTQNTSELSKLVNEIEVFLSKSNEPR